MIRSLVILFAFFFTHFISLGQNIEDSIKLGNKYYTEDRFEDAINTYENIVSLGYEAPELYFNLGNAYFKSHKITYAILNYERAKLLDPRNEDINYNLEIASSFVVDKMETVPDFFILQWHKSLVNMFSGDTWAIISIVSFILLLLFLSVYLYTRTYGIKKLSFWINVLLLYLTVSSFVFSMNHRKGVLHPGTALILTPSITVESSPDESGTDLFLIHEGTKVNVKESVGEWTRIKLSDGKEGWVPTSSIVEI